MIALSLSLLAPLPLAVAALRADAPPRPALSSAVPPAPVASGTEVAPPVFTDVSRLAGLDFVHFNGMSGEHYFPEVAGPGAALFDYDNDGDLDLYLVQGAMLGSGKRLADATYPPPVTSPPSARLLRNDLVADASGKLTPHLVDVTAASGIHATGYGMGVATGDYDNDGFPDLYVTSFGSNQLFHNNGDGTFTDVTRASGTDDPRWSVGATFFDYDRDGWLDLFVVDYVDYSIEKNVKCYAESSRRDWCGPATFAGTSDRLFHNRGDGSFEDVSLPSGIAQAAGPGLGVVAADLDGDGWTDLYVTNDGKPNFLWHNRHDGTFSEDGLISGASVNHLGLSEASMGVDAGDFDADGDEDLFMTHLSGETNTLFVNVGGGLFEDRSIESGLAPPSLPFTSFGTGWLDYDGDGWLDLLTMNGAVRIQEAQAASGDPFPLRQTNQLFHNLGNGRFEDATAGAGAAFALSEVSRGAAFGDVDNDGDTDVLEMNDAGPARLLRNDLGDHKRWIGLRLVGGKGGRDQLGARVRLARPGLPDLWRRAHADGSYASASDPRVLIGLGDGPAPTGAAPTSVEVHWPDGSIERFSGLAAERYNLLRQGSGEKASRS